MAISKNFVVKNGLEVADTLVYGTSALDRVGIGSTIPKSKLDVQGNLRAEGDLRAAGFGTVTKGFEVGIGGTMLTVEATGLIGINKATPLYSLDVIKIGSGTTAINAVGSVVATENVTIGGTVTASRGSFSSYVRIAGVTTLAADGGITTTGGDLYVGGTLYAPSLNITGGATLGDDLSTRNIIASGIVTVTGNTDLNGDLDVDGHTELDNVNISGIVTAFDLDVDGRTELDITNISETLNVVGVSTFGSDIDINASIDVDGHTELDDLNVSGVSTFVGFSTFNDFVFIQDGLNVAGVVTATEYTIDGTTVINNSRELQNIASLDATTTATIEAAIAAGPNTFDDLKVTGITTLGFTTATDFGADNINITGITTLATFTATSGVVGSAVTVDSSGIDVTGVVTATSFVGDGSQLTNTGAELTTSSAVLRILSTSLTSGIVTSAVAEAELTYDAATNVLNVGGGLNVTSGVSTLTSAVVGSAVTVDSSGINVTGVVTATSFVGDGSNVTGISTLNIVNYGVGLGAGIASTITVADESTDTTCFPIFATDATGDINPKTGSNLTFNSATGALTATSFVGDLTGNADTATAATRVTLTDQSADTTCFPVFCQSATGDQLPHTNSSLTYNSSNGTLTATTFSGALSGNATSATTATSATSATSATTATNANNINLADESSDTTCFPVFATDATGNQAPKTDSSALTYNASTGTLAAINVNSTSDANLKENVENIVGSIDILKDINGVKFVWKELGTPSVGVIAQDVEKVLPELVSQRSDNGTKSVNYNGLVGVLIEAVKELSARVESLENQLNNQ